MKKIITNEKVSLKSKERTGMKRRDFFKLLGGGIFIFFQPWDPFKLLELQAQQGRSLPTEFNAFLQIAEDGSVNCYTVKLKWDKEQLHHLLRLWQMSLKYRLRVLRWLWVIPTYAHGMVAQMVPRQRVHSVHT